MIKNLTPQLAERGKIKIGGLGDERKKKDGSGTYMLPVKYDAFKITTIQRDAAGRFIEDKELMARIMEKQGVQKLLEIPVKLLYDDLELNCQTRYSSYSGTRCFCSGDGEWAQRFGEGMVQKWAGDVLQEERKAGPNEYGTRPCPCERLESAFTGPGPKCKPLTTLQVLLEGVDRVGGVWKFRSTSWNTLQGILSSLALIKTITGGVLAGIPLVMILSPKTVSTPDGKTMVAHIVSLEYRGSEEKLAEIGYEIALRRIERRVKMDTVEVEARKLLLLPHLEPAPEQADTAAEFYPDPEAEGTAAPKAAGGKKKAPATQPPAPDPEPTAAATAQSQEPGNGGEQEAPEATVKENLTVHPAITLPALMKLAKEPDGLVDLPIPLVTTKGVPIGQWLDWGPDLGGDMSITLELVDNLEEVTVGEGYRGLTVAVIQKAFNEAGIVLKITRAEDAQQEGKERLEDLKSLF